MTTETIKHAKNLWDYFKSFKDISKSDAIIVCCSYDLRVCDYACKLLEDGLADKIVFSGNKGRWTSMIWDEPEADIFYKRALENNVDPRHLIIEPDATNIGENISKSKQKLTTAKRVVFLTKPNTLLRVKLTVPVQWSGVDFYTACPDITFPDDVSNIVGLFGLISEMVGDVERIIEYPSLGYQVKHELPGHVLSSYIYLKEKGFTHCL